MAKQNSKHKQYWFTEKMCDQIKEIAEEKGMSETEVLECAFRLYYANDIMPEHIILGRMTQLQHMIDTMDTKLETLGGIFYTVMPYIFGVLPPLPKNEVNAKGIKYNPALDKGNDIFMKLITGYRNQMKIHRISFVQSVWGDLQEDLHLTHVNDDEGEIVERSSGN